MKKNVGIRVNNLERTVVRLEDEITDNRRFIKEIILTTKLLVDKLKGE